MVTGLFICTLGAESVTSWVVNRRSKACYPALWDHAAIAFAEKWRTSFVGTYLLAWACTAIALIYLMVF